MSWNAQRFKPGKPVIRAIRHRKKILSKIESEALGHVGPTPAEIAEALLFAQAYKLWRWVAIIQMAKNCDVLVDKLVGIQERYEERTNECIDWKSKYHQEHQKVIELHRKIGSLKQSRRSSRTRMRSGGRTTRC